MEGRSLRAKTKKAKRKLEELRTASLRALSLSTEIANETRAVMLKVIATRQTSENPDLFYLTDKNKSRCDELAALTRELERMHDD